MRCSKKLNLQSDKRVRGESIQRDIYVDDESAYPELENRSKRPQNWSAFERIETSIVNTNIYSSVELLWSGVSARDLSSDFSAYNYDTRLRASAQRTVRRSFFIFAIKYVGAQ